MDVTYSAILRLPGNIPYSNIQLVMWAKTGEMMLDTCFTVTVLMSSNSDEEFFLSLSIFTFTL